MPLPPYPTTLPEFSEMFVTEEQCDAYLFLLRFPDGFVCPSCGHDKAYLLDRERMVECAACKRHVYLTAGTIMHKTHTPLRTWFYGAFLVTTVTPGLSAVQFQKQMGLSRYETAFQILHKIRQAMVDPTRGRLEGVVEVDETFIGGVAHGGKGGRSTDTKALVIGAVEVREKAGKRGHYAGRLRLRVIENSAASQIEPFVFDAVAPRTDAGATEVRTDGWSGYNGLSRYGYRHIAVTEGRAREGSKVLPLIHREFANLKTWLQGTHHGRVEQQHLQAYLNEFVFRHNRRFWPFSAFQTVLRLGMDRETTTYEELYAAEKLGRGVHQHNPAEDES